MNQNILAKKHLLLDEIRLVLSDSKLLPQDKQNKLENLLNTPLNYLDYLDYLDIYKKEKYSLRLKEIQKAINSINYNKVSGKTFFEKFFKVFNKNVFNNVILISFILRVIFESIAYYSLSTLSLKFLESIEDYIKLNKLKIIEFEDLEFKQKLSAYTLEVLKEFKILEYYSFWDKYIINNFDIDLFMLYTSIGDNYFLFFKKDNWPLLVEPKIYNSDTYSGGYHTLNKTIRIDTKYVDNIVLKDKGFEILNKYQKLEFKLNNDSNIKLLLYKYKSFLFNKIEKNLNSRKNFLEDELIIKNKKRYSSKLFEAESFYEVYYLLIQYFKLVETQNLNIFFTYKIDFRGRIYNSLFYGLNPTTSKLSRLLINTGKYTLTEQGKADLKLFIFAKSKIESELEFQNLLSKVREFINTKFVTLQDIDFDNLEVYILLIDWITNVEVNNTSEMLVELDASQSGFQMLSMFSNDINGLVDTNVLINDKQDLYTKIFSKLKYNIETKKLTNKNFKLTVNNLKIINRKYIKKIIMTIPYGSTQLGQKEMFLEVFNKDYGLRKLYKKNTIPTILESEILGDKETILKLKSFSYKIESGAYLSLENGDENIVALENIIIHQELLEEDLLNNFIPELLLEISNIVKEEYNTIINFVNMLKEHIRINFFDYKIINTEYYKFSILYYHENEYTYSIKNSKYKYYIVDYNKFDKRKTLQGSVANICHGLGDSFILYKLIELLLLKDLKFYTIHDAILCRSIDVNIIKEEVQKSYQYVYDYVIGNKIFKFYNILETYKFNSKNIFKIK